MEGVGKNDVVVSIASLNKAKRVSWFLGLFEDGEEGDIEWFKRYFVDLVPSFLELSLIWPKPVSRFDDAKVNQPNYPKENKRRDILNHCKGTIIRAILKSYNMKREQRRKSKLVITRSPSDPRNISRSQLAHSTHRFQRNALDKKPCTWQIPVGRLILLENVANFEGFGH